MEKMSFELENLHKAHEAFKKCAYLLSIGLFLGEYAKEVASTQNFMQSLILQSKEHFHAHPEFLNHFYQNGDPIL